MQFCGVGFEVDDKVQKVFDVVVFYNKKRVDFLSNFLQNSCQMFAS